MPKHCEKRKLPYPVALLYGIVEDVKSYPQFLPWIKEAVISNKQVHHFDAKLTVGYNAFVQTSYTSRVHLTPYSKIHIEYLSGPFQHLDNQWTFTSINEQETEIEFLIDFSFKNQLLQNLMDKFFNEAFKKTLQAFEKRAIELYSELSKATG
ncbi:MAG: type II toxin-antitoxin system RatA family toxin [Alphaproteobacteria bacterium]|nr:type II toxin-antitoxin system RatA family toxin [Alphaproteobacteria bacterium]